MKEQVFVDWRFIYNFIRNQNKLDYYAVVMMQFYHVRAIDTIFSEIQLSQQERVDGRLP